MDEADELAALRRENAILRETLDAVDGTIVVYDSARRYVIGNKAYHEHFPHLPPDAELVGKLFEEVLALSISAGSVVEREAYTDTLAFIERRIREVNAGEAAPREVFEPNHGHWYVIRVKLTPSGSRVSLRVDIDDQKRVQTELLEARIAAEAAARAKSMLLANTGHELRTPLNAVINFARLMEEEIHGPIGSPAYADFVTHIRESGQHLLALIEDMMDLARAESGRLTLHEQNVDLGSIIRSVCRLLDGEAHEAGVRLLNDVSEPLPRIRADGTRMRQILLNLLSNAIKYSGAGATVRVVASLASGGQVLVAVVDTGPGIPASDVQRIMRPFERGSRKEDRLVPGMGLGLPLVRHLVALHDAELLFESTPGNGTAASFRIPANRVLVAGMEHG